MLDRQAQMRNARFEIVFEACDRRWQRGRVVGSDGDAIGGWEGGRTSGSRTRPLLGSSCGLCRLLADLDPVDWKEVHRAPPPCGHTRSGHPDGGQSQTWCYCDHAIAAGTTAPRSLGPDIADAQFAGILPHFCAPAKYMRYDVCRGERPSLVFSGQTIVEGPPRRLVTIVHNRYRCGAFNSAASGRGCCLNLSSPWRCDPALPRQTHQPRCAASFRRVSCQIM